MNSHLSWKWMNRWFISLRELGCGTRIFWSSDSVWKLCGQMQKSPLPLFISSCVVNLPANVTGHSWWLTFPVYPLIQPWRSWPFCQQLMTSQSCPSLQAGSLTLCLFLCEGGHSIFPNIMLANWKFCLHWPWHFCSVGFLLYPERHKSLSGYNMTSSTMCLWEYRHNSGCDL